MSCVVAVGLAGAWSSNLGALVAKELLLLFLVWPERHMAHHGACSFTWLLAGRNSQPNDREARLSLRQKRDRSSSRLDLRFFKARIGFYFSC